MPVTVTHQLSATTPDDPSYEIRPSHWNSAHAVTIAAVGSEISGAFGNGGGVTFGLSADGKITAAAPAGGGGLTNINISAGTASNNLSSFVFSNGNGVSFGLDGSTVTATVQTNYLTTAMASNRGSDFVQATAAFAGTNASGTIASNGISVSVAAQSNQSAIKGFGVSNTGQTAGNTGISTGVDWVLAGSNSITLSQSTAVGGPNTVWVQHPAWITTARASNDAVGLNTALTAGPLAWTVNSSGISLNAGSAAGTTSGFTGGASISGSMTHNTAGLAVSLSHPAWITTARASTDAIGLNTAQSNVTWTVNSSGLSLDARGYAGTATTFAGANISGSMTVNSAGVNLSLSGGAGTTNQTGPNIGVSNLGNTAGSTGTISTGTYVLVGSNGITLSQSTGAAGSNGTVTILGMGPHQSYHAFPMNTQATLTFSFAQSTSFVYPMVLSYNLSLDRMRVIASASVAASSTQATTGNTSFTMSGATSHNIVIYSRGAGANSDSLQYLTSTQAVDQCIMTASIAANSSQHSVSLRYTLGNQSFTKDYSSSVTRQDWHTSHLTDLTGMKYLDVPLGISLAPGQYWIAYGRSTTFNTQVAAASVATRMLVSMNSMIAISNNTLALGMLGGGTNSSVGWAPGHGSFTTGGAAGTTNSIPLANVSTTGSNNVLYAQFMRIA